MLSRAKTICTLLWSFAAEENYSIFCSVKAGSGKKKRVSILGKCSLVSNTFTHKTSCTEI